MITLQQLRRIAVALLSAIVVCGCFSPVFSSQSGSQEILVLYSNDVLGETEPCG